MSTKAASRSRNCSSVVLRPAKVEDTAALQALAERDCDTVPPDPLMLAEVDGEILAALAPGSGRSIADPFHPTADLVELLRTHALPPGRDGSSRRHGRLAAGLPRRAPWPV